MRIWVWLAGTCLLMGCDSGAPRGYDPGNADPATASATTGSGGEAARGAGSDAPTIGSDAAGAVSAGGDGTGGDGAGGDGAGGDGAGGNGTDSPAVTNAADGTDGDSGAAGAGSNPSNDDAVGESTPSALGDCSEPYVGPVGGPRKDGPEPIIAPCDAISDEVILARYQNEDLRVPNGLYWEPPSLISTWEAPCSSSLSDTIGRAAAAGLLEAENQTSSDWSHEVSACHDGTRSFYSNLNCDYWLIAGQTVQSMLHFASVLWWIEHRQSPGSSIVGYNLHADLGSAADLCTVRTQFGEPGVCDEITVERTYYFTQVSGLPLWGDPVVVRTLRGYCD